MPKFKLFKDRKGKADQAKNNRFVKLARDIYVQAKRGGPNPEANFALKSVIAQARKSEMPVENIERAIKKATGTSGTADYEDIYYEGYGPGGSAVLVKCLSDNRNRTAANVRAIFNKNQGNMGESGCVSYLFEQKGILTLIQPVADEDQVMLDAIEAGADDIEINAEEVDIFVAIENFRRVKETLESQGYSFDEAHLSWIPKTTVALRDEPAQVFLKLLDALDNDEDVQEVFSNAEIKE